MNDGEKVVSSTAPIILENKEIVSVSWSVDGSRIGVVAATGEIWVLRNRK